MGKYYKAKAEKAEARADGYQAQVEIAQGREEVQHEVEKGGGGDSSKGRGWRRCWPV